MPEISYIHVIVPIVLLILTCTAYALLWYRHYLARRGGERVGDRSTFLDGLILIAIVGIMADGAAHGQLAVEVAICAVGVLSLLRALEHGAFKLANRGHKASPAGRVQDPLPHGK